MVLDLGSCTMGTGLVLFAVFAPSLMSANDIGNTWPVCQKSSCKDPNPPNGSFVNDCNLHEGYRLIGRCCVDLSTDTIIGLDLAYCDLKGIASQIRSEAPDVVRVNLTNNYDLKLENESFKGLTKLRNLAIDRGQNCPGEWNWFNITWKAWNATFAEKHQTRCVNQSDTCAKLYGEHNYTCPDHSNCTNDGPGSFLCECNKHWGGYRCLRERSHSLKVYILSVIAGCTVVLSSFLWFTQRRHIDEYQ